MLLRWTQAWMYTSGGLLTAGMRASIVIKRPYRLFRTLWISLHPQISGNSGRPLTQMYDRQAVRRVTIATLIGSLDKQHTCCSRSAAPTFTPTFLLYAETVHRNVTYTVKS